MNDLSKIIAAIPKRNNQAEVNKDLFWLLTQYKWSYDSIPPHATEAQISSIIKVPEHSLSLIREKNDRDLCLTSTTLNVKWRSDFAKRYDKKLVQIEAQFGKTELMFKDFCGFQIAYFERRLALGIEIVFYNPNEYFSHRRKAISGMSNFGIAKETLLAINFNCPIWLIGIDG